MLGLFVYNAAIGQECREALYGQVLDFHDQTPLVGATVYIL